MTPKRWRRVEELYHLALARPTEERAAFLELTCPNDAELRREVSSLLAQSVSREGILEQRGLATFVADLTDESVVAPSPVGTRFGAYEITSLIGAGGMGEVYRGRDARLGRDVAIKILPAIFTGDPERLARFLREARAASALNHPNIVTVYDIGEAPAGRFIVMELVNGHTFRQFVAERAPLASVLPLVTQVAKALGAAHSAGIVHRDIKPENLMIREDGYVKVVDFGLARLTAVPETGAELDTGVTVGGRIVGTVRYMSPEQALGREVTGASDVFSLGIVLYELATGNHPFGAVTTAGLLAAIAADTPLSATHLNAEVPMPLDELLQRMLQKDPGARPSAEQVADALGAMAGSQVEAPTLRQLARARNLMVGREAEWAALWAALEHVRSGRSAMVTVSGEAGLGKTALVEHFLAHVRSSALSCRIGRGRCSQRFAGTGGYLPLIEALEDVMGQSFDPAAARALKTVAPTWFEQIRSVTQSAEGGPPPAPPSLDRLKRELTAVIQELAAQRPLVLFLDDLHWADASTVDVLAYLMDRPEKMPVLFVATFRPSELHRGNQPFADLKLELVTRGLCEELRLRFLVREDIDRYLALEYSGHTFPPEFAALVHARTEGHPLFMVDLLRYLRERGTLAFQNEQWGLTRSVESIESAVPESVQSMIERKLEQLSDVERRLLVGASVQGDAFDVAVVAAALEMDPSDVEEKLEPAERLGIVRMVEDHELPDRTLTTGYRFVHVLYHNALSGSLRAARRASLSRAMAQALLRFHGRHTSKIALQLAFLFEAARDFDQAAGYFLTASQNAQRSAALKEAVVLARRGLAMLELMPQSEERDRRELALQIALMVPAASLNTHNAPDALAAFGRVRELGEHLGERPSLLTILVGRVWARLSAGETGKALEDAEECLRLAEAIGDAGSLVAAHFVVAGATTQLGDLRRACRHYEAAARLYDPHAHKHLAYLFVSDPGVHVRIEHAGVLFQMGEFARALDLAAEARTLARRTGHALTQAAVLTRSIALELRGRRLDEAERFVAELATLVEQNELVHRIFLPYYRGWLAASRGNIDEGLAQIRLSGTMMSAAGFQYGIPSLKALIAELLRRAGHCDEALPIVDEALSEAHAIGELQIVPELLHQRGTLLLMKAGERPGPISDFARLGETSLREAIALAREHGSFFYQLRAAVSLARWLFDREEREQAAALLGEICERLSGEPEQVQELAEARALLTQLVSGAGN